MEFCVAVRPEKVDMFSTLTTPMATNGCTLRVILAHANTRKHLSTTTRVEGWNFTFPPSPPGAIPAEVFADERTVQLNGATIALKHYAPAHTDSDISFLFTEADIFHVADTFWNGYYPFIDYSTGGSIDGMIRVTEANLAKVTDKMIVIRARRGWRQIATRVLPRPAGWHSRESGGPQETRPIARRNCRRQAYRRHRRKAGQRL